jgi:hypothetical protein
MLELAFFFCAFWVTNWVARRFSRVSPIWGLHAVLLAVLIGSFCLFALKTILAALQDLPEDAPLWRFDTPFWVWLVPSVVGSVLSVLLITGMFFLFSWRYKLRLVRLAGQAVWPERYWVHACIALTYTVGLFFVATSERRPTNAYIYILIFATWLLIGRLMLLERRRKIALSKQIHDPRAPTLLLRSFVLAGNSPDRRTGEERGRSKHYFFTGKPSFEERLAAAIGSSVGPLRALGDPADVLPELGATRRYVSTSRWQDIVSDEMAKAQCILVMEGSSPGLRWEWEFIFRNMPTQKVFLLTYPNGFPGRNEWRSTVAMLEDIGINIRSDDPGGMSLYRFRDDWEGELLLSGGCTESQVAEILRSSGVGVALLPEKILCPKCESTLVLTMAERTEGVFACSRCRQSFHVED